MATYSNAFTLLDTPDRIWAVLADLPGWHRILAMPEARKRGWGDRFYVISGQGVGAQLKMINQETEVFQDWVVEEWAPPRRMKLSSVKCYAMPATHLQSTLQFDIAPVSAGETRVEITFDAAFSDPVWSLVLFWMPLRGHLRKVVANMERGIADALSV